MAVDLLALVAALFHPFPLYIVLLLYWGDVAVGTGRRACQSVLAASREEESPTDPPAINRNGDPSPFRFLTPKLGTIQPVDWLPPVALHNIKPGVVGLLALALTGLTTGLAAALIEPPFAIRSWPTIGILAVGSLAIVAKHGWILRQFVRLTRPPAKRVLPGLRWPRSILMALPVVAVDTVHAGADFDPSTGFFVMAVLVVAGRIVCGTRRCELPTGADPFELSAPEGQPIERFRTDRQAVRIAGLVDGILPRIEWDTLTIGSRLAAVLLLFTGGLFASSVVGPTTAIVGGSLALTVGLLGVALAGVVHFELAFGAMEYWLYDEELVAYDTRLNAVQWRVPLDAIRSISVDRGFWTEPPLADAGTLTLDRCDLAVERSPYGFYRQTLIYVEMPERVADQLRQVTTQRSVSSMTGC